MWQDKLLKRWRTLVGACALVLVCTAPAPADQRLTPQPAPSPKGWLSPSPPWHYWLFRMPWICRCCKGYGFTDCKYLGYHSTQWSQWPPDWSPRGGSHGPPPIEPPKAEAETLPTPRPVPDKMPPMPDKMSPMPDKGLPHPETSQPLPGSAISEPATPEQPRIVPVIGQPIPGHGQP
jgi:hypothetical protein